MNVVYSPQAQTPTSCCCDRSLLDLDPYGQIGLSFLKLKGAGQLKTKRILDYY